MVYTEAIQLDQRGLRCLQDLISTFILLGKTKDRLKLPVADCLATVPEVRYLILGNAGSRPTVLYIGPAVCFEAKGKMA